MSNLLTVNTISINGIPNVSTITLNINRVISATALGSNCLISYKGSSATNAPFTTYLVTASYSTISGDVAFYQAGNSISIPLIINGTSITTDLKVDNIVSVSSNGSGASIEYIGNNGLTFTDYSTDSVATIITAARRNIGRRRYKRYRNDWIYTYLYLCDCNRQQLYSPVRHYIEHWYGYSYSH